MYVFNLITTGFHGRSRELSGLQYCSELLAVHGGCTQRVIVFVNTHAIFQMIEHENETNKVKKIPSGL